MPLAIGVFSEKSSPLLAFCFDENYVPEEHSPSRMFLVPAKTLLQTTEENRKSLYLSAMTHLLNQKGKIKMTIPTLDLSTGCEFVSVALEIDSYKGFAKFPILVLAPYLSGTSKTLLALSNLVLEEAEDE
jgi:hypothetical protein